ncbi:MAG: DMT family transporter [Coriobacteriales bacterium]|nr:DMT family transporter [Coriobacteriales bacterium]
MTSTTARRQELAGLGSIAVASLIWATIPLVIRAVDGASIIKVFFRVFFAGASVAGYLVFTGRIREITQLSRPKLLQIAGQAVVLTINWTLFLTALDLANVATVELLAYTGPVFVAIGAPWVTGERFDRRIVLPLALALGGIVVIMAPQGLGVAEPRELLGAFLAFCAAITYAVLLLRSKKILRGVSGTTLMTIEYAVASLLLAPAVAWFYARGDAPSSPGAYGALVILGVVQTAFAGLLFLGGLRRVRTDRAAILTYGEPVAAVAFAAAFLGESLTIATVLGGLMVVTGGIIVTRLEAPQHLEPVPLEAAGTEDEPALDVEGADDEPPLDGNVSLESRDAKELR